MGHCFPRMMSVCMRQSSPWALSSEERSTSMTGTTAAERSHAFARSARDKVVSVKDLVTLTEQARSAGKIVVLAHGVFDLLHLGHVRHLEAARREGDMLVVTITADRFVNKGPGRPVFDEHLRAEMLASLEHVDWVAVNQEPDAETLLAAVGPDVYVKGSDYATAEEDVTGKIVKEREAVERRGGRIIFTNDITFSSSTLINKYLNIYDPSLQVYLERMRGEGGLDSLLKGIDAIGNLRVLFVGDTIIDEYNYVIPMAKAPKENMIATLFQERELFAGGVIAAANHTANFCREVHVVTSLGDIDSHEELVRRSLKANVSLSTVRREGAPTTRKARFIDSYAMRKLFEVYSMDDMPLPGGLEAELDGMIEGLLDRYDLVVVTDFGHGLIGRSTINLLNRKARFLAVNAQTNSGNLGFNMITKYPRADFVCIDGNEARLAMHDKFTDMVDLVGGVMAERMSCPNMIVTGGKSGCVAYQRDTGVWRVPALTNTIVDTVGAGDAFFAIAAPLVAAGVPLEQVGFLGNAAGALKVGIVGHRSSVERPALVKFITALLK